jgi:putative hydrolase of the HAD superfamily
VTFIFFDIDGTLVDHEKAAEVAASRFFRHFAHILPGSREAQFLIAWHEVSERHNDLYFQGEVTLIEQRRNRMRELFASEGSVFSNAEADSRFQVYLKYYEANWTLFDDVIPCLDELKHSSKGLISNGNLEQQLRKLKRTRLENRFSPIIVSSEMGTAKPKPDIFLKACQRAGVSPEDCVYVGDRLEIDVWPSCSAGMKGIWLNRKNLPMPTVPVPMISTLSELANLIMRIGGQGCSDKHKAL